MWIVLGNFLATFRVLALRATFGCACWCATHEHSEGINTKKELKVCSCLVDTKNAVDV